MGDGGPAASGSYRGRHRKDFSFCATDAKRKTREDVHPAVATWEEVKYGSLCGLESERELARAGHTTTAVDDSLIVMFGFRKEPRSQGKTYLKDVLRFDARSGDWFKVGELGAGRGHHTATLIGRRIWVIGGQDSQYIFDGVLCFDVDKLKWVDLGKERKGGFQITWPRTREGQSLARRTCHAATLHPYNDKAIVVCGGISQAESGAFVCRNDIFMLNTISGQVQMLMKLDYGGMSFHSAVTIKSSILIIGGNQGSRHTVSSPTTDCSSGRKPVLEVLFPMGREWRRGDVKVQKGHSLLKVSSHASVEYNGKVFCHGGLRSKKKLTNDFLCLGISREGGWECMQVPTTSTAFMEARLTHTLSIVNEQLYVFGGCLGSHIYSGKMWRLNLRSVSGDVGTNSTPTALVPPETPRIRMVPPLSHAYSTPVGIDDLDLKAARAALEDCEAWQLKELKRSEKLRNREILHDELARRLNTAMAFGNSLNTTSIDGGSDGVKTWDTASSRKLSTVPVEQVPWSTESLPPMETTHDRRRRSSKSSAHEIKKLKEDLENLSLDNEQLVAQLDRSNRACCQESERRKQLQKELDDLMSVDQEHQDTIKEQEAIIDEQTQCIRNLQKEAERANDDLRERSNELRQLQATIADLEEEIQSLRESMQECEDSQKETIEMLLDSASQEDEEVEMLAAKLENTKIEILKCRDWVGKAAENQEGVNGELEGCMGQADDVNHAKESLAEDLAELRKEYSRAEKDHSESVREWEALCTRLRSDTEAEIFRLREVKDVEVSRLKQLLLQKETAMKCMQAEFATKLEAKNEALAEAHKAATKERESLFQDRHTARIQLVEERTTRSAEVTALKTELEKARVELRMSRSKVEELQLQRISRSEAVGQAVRSRRKDIQELADRFGRDLAEIDEKYAKAMGFLGSAP